MHKRRLSLIWLCTALLLGGCTAGRPVGGTGIDAPDESRRLVVYTSHKQEVYEPIIKEFEARTGIWVEVVAGGTNEMLERIAREAERPVADVMFGGGVESLESYRSCFTPYASAELEFVLDQYRAADDLWTPFSSLPVVLIYNTKLVATGEVGSWYDLLEPRFQGRIAFVDPMISGSCFTGLVTLQNALGGERDEASRRFAESLDGIQLDNSGLVLSTVADGTNLVGVTLEETALQRIAAGDDIALVYPADGTSCVPDGSALIQGARHEDNAKLFLDFTVGRDVQTLLGGRFYRRPVRADVEQSHALLDEALIPRVEYDVGFASRNRDSILMTWAFYLGGRVLS